MLKKTLGTAWDITTATWGIAWDFVMTVLPKELQGWMKTFLSSCKTGEKWMGAVVGGVVSLASLLFLTRKAAPKIEIKDLDLDDEVDRSADKMRTSARHYTKKPQTLFKEKRPLVKRVSKHVKRLKKPGRCRI